MIRLPGAPVVIALCALAIMLFPHPSFAEKCLFVSSYHKGYAWSDGVERGLRSVLTGRCEIRQFDMDTKRRKSPKDIANSVAAARQVIDTWRPDVVITADDNAAKYLIKPHYRDHTLPFVFSGINWTVREYGFPYRNVTGIVEVAPIRPMLEQARSIVPGARRVFYIGVDALSERKNLARFKQAAKAIGLKLDSALATNSAEWIKLYRRAQKYDFVVIGNKAGAREWSEAAVSKTLLTRTRRLSVTNHGWMMPYTILGVTKVPEEHGEWAAKAALTILAGTPPNEIPIVSNTRRDLWVNHRILDASGIRLPEKILGRAKRIAE